MAKLYINSSLFVFTQGQVLLCICRFYEVAMLKYMWWLEILGSLEAKLLSANTTYGVYFIFNFENHESEFIYLNQYSQPRTYGDLLVCFGTIDGYRKRVCLWMDGSRDGRVFQWRS